MHDIVRASILDREGLALGLTDFHATNPETHQVTDLVEKDIPAHGGILVSWDDTTSDPLADLLIVRDSEVGDTLAWIGSFLGQLAPVTQWCRVVPQKEAISFIAHSQKPTLGAVLPLWVGAVIAECSTQAEYNLNLRELPVSAALTSATFAAGRTVAVLGSSAPLSELASKHNDLATRLRERGRPITASRLLPMWYCLYDQEHWSGAASERKALEPIAKLLKRLLSLPSGKEGLESKLSSITDEFDLPELIACSRGPQAERVEALDLLVSRVTSGPITPAVEAIVGLGASMVDPGATVLPDLLPKQGRSIQTSPIWLGLFAGAWDRFRVLTDHQGLGRLIAKVLISKDDIRGKPSCDIAFDELNRWIGSSGFSKIPVRGMSARSLIVEFAPGVTCSFAIGRSDGSRVEGLHSADLQSRYPDTNPPPSPELERSTPNRQQALLDPMRLPEIVEKLLQRVSKLEALAGEHPDLFSNESRNAEARSKRRGYGKSK